MSNFLEELKKEIPKWISSGIIREEQSEKILALYRTTPEMAAKPKEIADSPQKVTAKPQRIEAESYEKTQPADMKSKTTAILIGLACVLLSVGIILFYASNWKYMPPTLKMMQVFGLIVLTYVTSYYFYSKGWEVFGRVFLIMGMISFGAAMALTTQIYHISAHGGTGTLIWALACMSMGFVMKERWGCYLAAALVWIWTGQIWFSLQDPNYLFPVAAALLIGLSWYLRSKAGMIITILETIFWFYQVNCCVMMADISLLRNETLNIVRTLGWTHIPLGMIMFLLSGLLGKEPVLQLPAQTLKFFGSFFIFGPLAVFFPLLGFSWGVGSSEQYLFMSPGVTNFLRWEYLLLVLVGIALLFLVYRSKSDYHTGLCCLAIAIVAFFTPEGKNLGLAIVTHLSIAGLLLWLCWHLKSGAGIVLVILEMLFWFHQVNFTTLDSIFQRPVLRTLALTHIPLGVLLLSLSRLWKKETILEGPSQFLNFLGTSFVFVPLIGLSFPMESLKPAHLFMFPGIADFLTTEYVIFLLASAILLVLLYLWKRDYYLPLCCLAIAVASFLVPMGDNVSLVVTTNLGLLLFLGAILFLSHTANRGVEKILAFFFMGTTLAVKCTVSFGLGVTYSDLYLAYTLGFIILGIICFLINQIVQISLDKKSISFHGSPINGICAFLAFFMVYAVSFKIQGQSPISNAPTLASMVMVFLAVAACLYAYLFSRASDKLALNLSAVIFFISVLIIYSAGPGTTWVFYSFVFNVLLFAIEGTVIYYGVHINSSAIVNTALAGFILHIVTRYFDLLFNMLSGSVLFITTGLLLLAGGYILEKNRRLLLDKIKANQKQENEEAIK